MRRNFRNPSSSSNNLNKIHLKFIRSYLPDIKIVLYNLHAEVVLFYLELELFSSLCAILRVQKLRSAIIFFNSNNPFQRTYQTGELFKKYNLYRDMTDILFYYFVKISKKKSPFFQWNHTCKIQR